MENCSNVGFATESDMTKTREQLIEKVQATLARPSAGGIAKSLRTLSDLATKMMNEKSGSYSDAVVDLVGDLRALSAAASSKTGPEEFQPLLSRLASALLQPPASETATPAVCEIEAPPATAAAPIEPPVVAGSLQALTNELADDPELVQEFLVESRDHLLNVESGLLILERDPGHKETLHSVFRSFHTIKGLASFLGAESVQELAHETESVLDLVRSDSLELSSELIDLILQSADALGKMLNLVGELKLSELPPADRGLLAVLMRYSKQENTEFVEKEVAEKTLPAAGVTGRLASEGRVEAVPVLIAEAATAETPVAAVPVTTGDSKKSAEAGAKQSDSGVVRVDTAKLEYLIDMVGELVIAESVVRNDPAVSGTQDPALSRNLAQLSRVVEEVQKTSMSMRMMPVGALFRKMTRLVRDLSRKSGKQVELDLFGEDVELDRTIVEELADPMVHMIRNAVDHGLESPAERIAAGKMDAGRVTLKALHDAGDIVIEISDNGRGLDRDRILAKARRVGLIGEDQTPDEAEIFRMIFEPGFSTAAKVTDLSGRGVGMDVVKRHIQKLRGRIDIKSVPGHGCTFTLRLPLTLAIIDGLVVSVGSQRYILPMFGVREMFSPTEKTFVTIENRAEAALFRDKLLPVVRLSNLFSIADGSQNPGILIIAEARDQAFCIAVDQLIGKQEVVIKNLGKTFRDVPAIAGGAILGDGRVGLILELNALR